MFSIQNIIGRLNGSTAHGYAAADVHDPKWLGSANSGGVQHYNAVPELYNLDGAFVYYTVVLLNRAKQVRTCTNSTI